MKNVDVQINEFTLNVDVHVVHMPIKGVTHLAPEDCYPAEEGMLEWEIVKITGADNNGLDISELESYVCSQTFENDLWTQVTEDNEYE